MDPGTLSNLQFQTNGNVVQFLSAKLRIANNQIIIEAVTHLSNGSVNWKYIPYICYDTPKLIHISMSIFLKEKKYLLFSVIFFEITDLFIMIN